MYVLINLGSRQTTACIYSTKEGRTISESTTQGGCGNQITM